MRTAAASAAIGRGAGGGGAGGGPHVLKFGSSVLGCPRDYPRVAAAVAREASRGRKVVAVVSAMGDATDALLAAAHSVAPDPPERLIGALLATGEEASVALLALALADRKVRAVGFNAAALGLRTRGPLGDAHPVGVDTAGIRRALGHCDAVVLPGFVGVDAGGAPSLLGRGGSDLTALFVGDALGAAEVRLVKDVEGVFPSDPRGCHRGNGSRNGDASGNATRSRNGTRPHSENGRRAEDDRRPYRELSWDQARAIGGGVVQPKALDFARRRGLSFRVAGLEGAGTRIGEAARWGAAR